jgi:tetratricopeptide (TPR) repeat protein
MKQEKNISSYFQYIILFVLSFVIYGNTMNHDFVLDDKLIIEGSPLVTGGSEAFPTIFKTNYAYGRTQFNDGLYRPLNILLFNLEYNLWGFNPKGYHFINILLYGILLLLIYKLLTLLFSDKSPLLAFLIALIFAVHPLHTEVVANVKSVDEILALLFASASFILHIRWAKTAKIWLLFTGSLLFALALLSKESSISFVFIIPFALLYIKQIPWKKSTISLIGLLSVAILWLFWRSYVIDSMPSPPGDGSFSLLSNSLFGAENFLHQFTNALWLQVLYIKQMLIPYPLLHDYSYNSIPLHSIFSWQAILTFAILIGIIYLLIKHFKTQKEMIFGFAFYLSSIFIVSNLFFLIGMTYAERFAFTPSLGIIIILVFIANKYLKLDDYSIMEFLKKGRSKIAIFGSILLLLSIMSISRNQDWKDNLSLYKADIEHLENSARGNYNYGTALMEMSQQLNQPSFAQQGIPYLQKAISIYPEYQDAYNNLAVSYMNTRSYDNAIKVLLQLIEKDTSYSKAYFNIGFCYYQQKNYSNSIKWLDRYNGSNKSFAPSYYYLAMCYGDQGKFEQAIEYLNKTISLQANHTEALMLRAKAHGITKNYIASLKDFESLLKLKPNLFEAEFMKAVTLKNIGRDEDAIVYLQSLDQKYPNNQDIKNLITSIHNN